MDLKALFRRFSHGMEPWVFLPASVVVARASKGRTIREFPVTALLVPTPGSFIWLAALRATGLDTMIAGGERVANLFRDNEALALFAVLDTLQRGKAASGVPDVTDLGPQD